MSLGRLFYHSAIYGLTTALSRFLNWLLTPLYVHRLPMEDFGRLSELYSWIAFGLIATGLGMETTYFRFARKSSAAPLFWRSFRLLLLVGSLPGLGSAALVPFIADELRYEGRENLLWLTIAIWTVDAWGAFTLAHQRLMGTPWRFALIQLTHVLLLLGLNLWGVGLRGYGLEFILTANLFASLLRLGWGISWGPPFSMSDTVATSSLLRYGATLAIIGLLGATNDVLDRVLLARYSWTDTALYSAAYKIAMALALFIQAYRQAGEPLLLSEHRGDHTFYRRSWTFYHNVALCGVLLLTLWSEPLLMTQWGGLLPKPIFPPSYHKAFCVVPLLLWAHLFMGSLVQASIWYKLSEKPVAGLPITATGSLITWIGNLYGIPRYGYIASAWTTLLAYAVMVSLSVWRGRKRLPGVFEFKEIAIPVLLVAIITIGYLKMELPAEEVGWRLWLSGIGIGVIGFHLYRLLRRG
ncbi:MAG: oligosaccharide flippase family protein [Bacteroidia bacterium]|nr:oligosaccharide flippase family protein [Bacteroidia bacterium]MDW8015774.1 oligosaccharide flippase family protein [Bacteroidia bacterium]